MEIALILATYVVTCVFVYSGGAWGSLEQLRNKPWMKRFGLLDCFLCTSFWVAGIATLIAGANIGQFFIAWAVAYIIDSLIIAYRTK